MISGNPFHLRISEHAGSDTRFLSMFGPGVLEALDTGELWQRLVVYRSSPGGGKTSILRLFTPGALRALHENRSQPATTELAMALTRWGVLSADGPTLLGIHLSCEQQYPSIVDLTDDAAARQRQFFALLNSRIILGALRGAVFLGGGDWPNDVGRIRINLGEPTMATAVAEELLGDGSGDFLYDRACQIERAIYRQLNDLGMHSDVEDVGHTDLWALHALGGSVLYENIPIASRALVMLDDVHLLHDEQRRGLREYLMRRDIPVARWIAERWQGLSVDETFGEGATEHRDYEIVQLDGWAEESQKRLPRFERIVADIANRRVQTSDLVQEQVLTKGAFEAFLQAIGDAPPTKSRLLRMTTEAKEKVLTLAGDSKRYVHWLADVQERHDATVGCIYRWRELEILIARDRSRRQGDFFPDEQLELQDLKDRGSTSVASAAELFAAKEHSLPYYYGTRRLALLGSWNIEQFLDIAGDVFDLVVMAVTLRRGPKVTPKQQDDIVRRSADALWQSIPRRVSDGEAVKRFVAALGNMAMKETYRPTAPYAPGVNGVAISMTDLARLKDETFLRQDPQSARLIQVLKVAVWSNLLQVQLDYPCKNERWAVFYLNRLLCAHFGLPLHYGGFREKRLAELKAWVTQNLPSALQITSAVG